MQSKFTSSFMSSVLLITLTTLITAAAVFPTSAQAQTAVEEKFHDLFVTAGYSTAFGAAFGAALLAFQDDPANNLRYIAMGASVGFIGGSVFGAYMMVAPAVVLEEPNPTGGALVAMNDTRRTEPTFTVKPSFGIKDGKLKQVEGILTLAQW